jgi:hypothetical protein
MNKKLSNKPFLVMISSEVRKVKSSISLPPWRTIISPCCNLSITSTIALIRVKNIGKFRKENFLKKSDSMHLKSKLENKSRND